MRNKFIADMKCPNCGGVPDSDHLNFWIIGHPGSSLRLCLGKMQCRWNGFTQSDLDALWWNNVEFQDFIKLEKLFKK